MNLVRLQDVPATPWRNGGGVTHDLLVWPEVGDGWQARVSVALIDRSGPFSMFAGVTRWFTVLDGAGVRLGLPRGRITLRPGDAPLQFDGADAPGCELIEGATHDLNFMAPHSAGSARMRIADIGSGIEGRTRWRGLFTSGAARLQVDDGEQQALDRGTLCWSADPEPCRWQLIDGGPAWWLTLEA